VREAATLSLFEGYGIELEYMIVDAGSLDVMPIADRLIEAESGGLENEIERGEFAWSNELARHVIEAKTNGPVPRLDGLSSAFDAELRRMHELLERFGARLLPTAMHPWMDSVRDFELWPHGSREIYETFDRIFDCRGHGWANLQSAHLNLPFSNDDEFGRLHAASRALLPLLPALAASSPFVDGRATGWMDTRLEVYRTNARRVPSVSGAVIPEPIYTRAGYEELLESIYSDLEPFDAQGILRHEWVNARGCIARFDRMAVEIRVLDVQECPAADVAIAAAISACLRALCESGTGQVDRIRSLETSRLVRLLETTTRDAERALVDDPDYLAALGFGRQSRRAGDLWSALIERDFHGEPFFEAARPMLDVIREEGTLASRIVRRVGALSEDRRQPPRVVMRSVWRELADCLRDGRSFRALA
jgi:gamma-glutamyl:cysteine ligase YbdK (ATP-grasp superfamily)